MTVERWMRCVRAAREDVRAQGRVYASLNREASALGDALAPEEPWPTDEEAPDLAVLPPIRRQPRSALREPNDWFLENAARPPKKQIKQPKGVR